VKDGTVAVVVTAGLVQDRNRSDETELLKDIMMAVFDGSFI
jgi:hypothetical protein